MLINYYIIINLLNSILENIFKYKQFNQYKYKKQEAKNRYISNNKSVCDKY